VSRPVRFRPEAEAEVLETHQWYEQRRRGLGTEFDTGLMNVVQRIAENPFQFPRVRGEIRRAVLSRFPYAVYFRIHVAEIIVLAVHGRQDPGRWQSRK
jgi:plasmid stabilization system protein ParE